MNKHYYSEIFRSLQGEGTYTGANSLWIRWFHCNLQCDGFGQDDPTNPDSYELPYKDYDLINTKTVEDLPVFDKGCDSSYTWSKKYKHLMAHEDAVTIVDKLEDTLRGPGNPNGTFLHPVSHQETHMCFTGGEPMLKKNQLAIVETMEEFAKRRNAPRFVTVETNGTQKLTDDMLKLIGGHNSLFPSGTTSEWFWSVSPKLFTTSGEERKKAIKPEVLAQYAEISNRGHLKYVVNGSNATWREVDEVTAMFREVGVTWPVFIMPVGATKESQEGKHIAEICDEALARGFNVSGRLHAYIYGNVIGT
jgi:organic radical activating enzyme